MDPDEPVEGGEGGMTSAGPAQIDVTVSFSPAPRQVEQVLLRMPSGATLADALVASGLSQRHHWQLDEHLAVGIWGKARTLATPLRQGDRVEVYRGLQVDPKEARRQRYRKQPDLKKSPALKS